MNREQQEESAALYALDLLEGRDRMAFAGALREDAQLRDFADHLRETVSLLACCEGEQSPPPDLKQRLQERIGREPAPSPAPAASPRLFPLLGWAVAACFAGLALWFGQLHYATRTENNLLVQSQSLADTALRSTRYQLEAEQILYSHELESARQEITRLARQTSGPLPLSELKVATCKSLLDQAPRALAVAVWQPSRQAGLMVVDQLPALPADKDYQLWILDPRFPSPLDGGVFQVDPASGHAEFVFTAPGPMDPVARFAVSIERKGGVARAEGPFVLAGD